MRACCGARDRRRAANLNGCGTQRRLSKTNYFVAVGRIGKTLFHTKGEKSQISTGSPGAFVVLGKVGTYSAVCQNVDLILGEKKKKKKRLDGEAKFRVHSFGRAAKPKGAKSIIGVKRDT